VQHIAHKLGPQEGNAPHEGTEKCRGALQSAGCCLEIQPFFRRTSKRFSREHGVRRRRMRRGRNSNAVPSSDSIRASRRPPAFLSIGTHVPPSALASGYAVYCSFGCGWGALVLAIAKAGSPSLLDAGDHFVRPIAELPSNSMPDICGITLPFSNLAPPPPTNSRQSRGTGRKVFHLDSGQPD
jgi:hypothetical protein